jgi:hypothetical protein
LKADLQKLNTPLTVGIESGQIVIRVGLITNKWAFERHPECQPHNTETCDFEQKWIVTDYYKFAEDVVRAMENEAEDGSTPLIEFLDEMQMAALEDGSEGVDEAPKGMKAIQ